MLFQAVCRSGQRARPLRLRNGCISWAAGQGAGSAFGIPGAQAHRRDPRRRGCRQHCEQRVLPRVVSVPPYNLIEQVSLCSSAKHRRQDSERARNRGSSGTGAPGLA